MYLRLNHNLLRNKGPFQVLGFYMTQTMVHEQFVLDISIEIFGNQLILYYSYIVVSSYITFHFTNIRICNIFFSLAYILDLIFLSAETIIL